MIAIGRNLNKSIELKYHLTCAWIGCSLLHAVENNLPVMSCADAALETAVHTGIGPYVLATYVYEGIVVLSWKNIK